MLNEAEKKALAGTSSIWENTPMAPVIDCLIKGEFAPAPEEPIGPHETELGELTDFEKAIYTAKNTIADSNNAMKEEATAKSEDPDGLLMLVKKNNQNITNHEALDKLFWASIQHRLEIYETIGIGIREGYKIVQLPPENPPGGLFGRLMDGDPLMRMMASLMGGEEDGEHMCATCKKYAECDLLFKKARPS